jgi:hypothetical protein
MGIINAKYNISQQLTVRPCILTILFSELEFQLLRFLYHSDV